MTNRTLIKSFLAIVGALAIFVAGMFVQSLRQPPTQVVQMVQQASPQPPSNEVIARLFDEAWEMCPRCDPYSLSIVFRQSPETRNFVYAAVKYDPPKGSRTVSVNVRKEYHSLFEFDNTDYIRQLREQYPKDSVEVSLNGNRAVINDGAKGIIVIGERFTTYDPVSVTSVRYFMLNRQERYVLNR